MKLIVSYGRKYGEPVNRFDEVHDVRRFRNPHAVPKLHSLTGLDPRVRAYVLSSSGVEELIAGIVARDADTVAVFCVGGKHRSVAIAEEIARRAGIKATHLSLRR